VKKDVVAEATGTQICSIDVHDLKMCEDISNMEVGGLSPETLSKLDAGKKKSVLLDIRKFYQAVTEYLQKKLPLKSPLVKYAQCLNPEVKSLQQGASYLKKTAGMSSYHRTN